ncbi:MULTISPECIES: hypothetical protein [Lentibacter]|nr:hypothetical protein [Lentibacter algarum]
MLLLLGCGEALTLARYRLVWVSYASDKVNFKLKGGIVVKKRRL